MVGPAATKWVLVADDDAMCQKVIAVMLKSLGATAVAAEDGVKCVKEFKTNPKKYKLILMDLSMPNMDGFEATMAIRKLDPKIRIIGISGDHDDETKQEAIRSGMNQLMVKPLKKTDLQTLLKSV